MGRLVSYCPGTAEEIGSVETIDVSELDGIIERSDRAQREWGSVPPKKRAEYFKRLSRIIADDVEELGRIVHMETGKPKAECINTEFFVSSAHAKYCADWLNRFRFEGRRKIEPMDMMMRAMGRRSYIRYKPAGVTACISPYNFPICIPFTECMSSVAVGNSVILKPSSDTPLCGELIVSLFKKAGFPEDLVICVHGPGIGSALTQSSMVRRIMFTGGTNTGMNIMSSASRNLIPVSLELGGCDSMIVLKDADIDRAVKAAVWGSFVNSGQVCVGVQRIMVHRSIYDDFVSKYVKRVSGLKIGYDYDDPTISLGPVINERAMNEVLEAVEEAKDIGAKVIYGGKRVEGLKGWFLEPAVITDIPTDSGLYNREVFGPFTTIVPFNDEDEAIELNNRCPYALGGSVWTKDVGHGHELAGRMDSGMVNVNNLLYNYGMPSLPWGGTRMSGFGKSHGEEGFIGLMEIQHLHEDRGGWPNDPWWTPYTKEGTDIQVEMTQSLFGSKRGLIGFFMHALPLLRKKE